MKTTKNAQNRQAALKAYETAIIDLLTMAEELPELIRDSYPAPDEPSREINWALVGTINHLKSEMKNIRDQIAGEGQYAR